MDTASASIVPPGRNELRLLKMVGPSIDWSKENELLKFDDSFPEELIEFVNWELNNTEKKAGNKLRGAKSATEAASLVDQFYERSTGAHRQKRMEFAAALMGPSTGDKVGKASQEVQVAQRQESSGGGATYNMNTQNTNVSQGKGQQAPAAVASTYDDVFTSLHTSIA